MARAKRTERSRTLILEAADAAFRELGLGGTSVEEIANRAGLTRKTVYNLFTSKEDIALQLIARVEANDFPYRDRIKAGENAAELLVEVFLGSARWCQANPSLAKLALAPTVRPTLESPPDRPSFQRLVRDILVLGQSQGSMRQDEDPNLMALILLGIYGQAMLSSLAGRSFDEDEIRRVIRIVVEGIGQQSSR